MLDILYPAAITTRSIMRITPDCDAIYVDSRDKPLDPESKERIGKRCFDRFNGVVESLQYAGLLSPDLEFDRPNLETIVKSFWSKELDVYVDGARYCSDCRKKYRDRIHCHVCDRCVPVNHVSDTLYVLKTCDACYDFQRVSNGPPPGVHCVGGFIGSGRYSFSKN